MAISNQTLQIWWLAARPHTLSASVVPVLVGSALALRFGPFSVSLFILTLLGSVLVQIGTNLTDEFADHNATASKNKFPAPHKVIARQLLTVTQVKAGAAAAFGGATFIGVWLVWQTGWPLLVICVVSLLLAFGYSAGPFPLGDYALGELLVFVVMGPIMVGATFYVQTGAITQETIWLSMSVGGLVTAIMVVNNLRDQDEDRQNGRLTLVTLAGAPMVRLGYLLLVAFAFAIPAWLMTSMSPWLGLSWLSLPLALKLAVQIWSQKNQEAMHAALRGTAALHLLFGLMLTVGLLVGEI